MVRPTAEAWAQAGDVTLEVAAFGPGPLRIQLRARRPVLLERLSFQGLHDGRAAPSEVLVRDQRLVPGETFERLVPCSADGVRVTASLRGGEAQVELWP